MKELGQILQTVRESQNLTLDDIQEATKIRKFYLQAIEDGNLSSLPGMVYAKGFIKNYAEQLGLDGQALMREHGLVSDPATITGDGADEPQVVAESQPPKRLAKASPVTFEQGAKHEAVKHDVTKQPANREGVRTARESRLLPQVIMGVTVIGLLGLGLWFLNNKGATAQPPIAQPGQEPLKPPAALPVPAQTNTTPPDPKTAEPLKADMNSSGTSTFKVEGQSIKLEVSTPNGECWVQITIDGKLKESKTMPQGAAVTYNANSEITVATGLSTSLAMKINDRPVELDKIKDRHDYVFQKK